MILNALASKYTCGDRHCGDGGKDGELMDDVTTEIKRDEQAFLSHCEEMRKLAFSFNDPLIVHHYDADGVSSGALVAGAFLTQGKKFKRECIKKLDDEAIDRYLKNNEREIIFVDLGGGNKRVNELNDVLIIDHHQTEGITKPQVNPLLFGIDGGDELSAAGTAYCIFREHADLAIVGAVGDMQSPLRGMNRWVLEQGVEKGEVRVEDDLRFYGRYCRPLVQFLAYSDDPYLPGISFREDRAEQLFGELKIPLSASGDDEKNANAKRVYADLKKEEKTAVISTIAKLLISSNKTKDLIGESYVFPNRPKNETYEANEFSTLLNACGRHGKPEIGVRVCLGDEAAMTDAQTLLQHHRRMLRSGIEYAGKHVQNFGSYYFLDGRGIVDEGIIGVVCGMALQQKWTIPMLGVSLGENNTLKFSGRAPRHLVDSGLNLGDLMKKGVAQVGGAGGGHKIAAGASIPSGKINEFLVFAGEYLTKRREQLDSTAKSVPQ